MNFIKKHTTLSILVIFLLISILEVLVYFGNGPFSLQWDGLFHMSRLTESYLSIKDGSILNAVPDTMTKSFFGFAYPQNLFYPIYTILPEVFIRLIVVNGWNAYIIFTILCNFLVLTSMYVFTNLMIKNKLRAYIASVLYGLSQFTLGLYFYYHTISGFVDLIFIPMVFYGIYQIALKNKQRWWILTFGMTLVILTDLPDSIPILLMVIITFGLSMTKFKFKEILTRFAYLCLSGLTCLLLSGFFIFPMLNALKATDINVASPKLYDTAPMLSSILLNTDKGNFYSIGIVGTFALVCIIMSFKKMNLVFRCLTIEVIFFILLWSNQFPWQMFQNELRFIQFTGRFAYIVVFLIALIAATVFSSKTLKYLAPILTIVGISSSLALNFSSIDVNSQNMIKISSQNYNKASMSCETLDYIPKKAYVVKPILESHSVIQANKNLAIVQDQRSTSYNTVNYEIKSKNNISNLVLPNVYYPGMHVYVNNREVKIKQNQHQLMVVPVNSKSAKISVEYQKTKLQIISGCISLFTLIGMIIYLVFSKRKS